MKTIRRGRTTAWSYRHPVYTCGFCRYRDSGHGATLWLVSGMTNSPRWILRSNPFRGTDSSYIFLSNLMNLNDKNADDVIHISAKQTAVW